MSIQLQEIQSIYVMKFTHVEYLEINDSSISSGAYIDTGVKIDSETAFIGTSIDFQIVAIDKKYNNSAVVAGSVLSTGENSYKNLQCVVYDSAFHTSCGFNFSQESDIYARTIATANGTAKGISNCNLILFARNINNGNRIYQNFHGKCRIFSCTIRKNGDVIRDFIPVRVGNKGYMYDKITKKLYGNAGTGDFVLGQDVGAPLHQIYTNKLVEGTDYMVGEWLQGDGAAWIDTKHNTNEDLDWSTRAYLPYPKANTANNLFWYRNESISLVIVGLVLSNNDTYKGLRIGNNTSEIQFPMQHDIDVEVIWNGQKVNINGTEYSTTKKSLNINYPFMLFRYSLVGVVNKFSSAVKCNYFKLGDMLHLVPCKLLRPIPRNLDAQCKSRVANECGMIDLISGRFYGNVADSGAFSLAWDEWLKDCSIQFNANYHEWTILQPPLISYKGRVKVANLPDELTDFGFVKFSKTQVVIGENVWSFNNWGSGTWATFDVSYDGGSGCGCDINGTSVGAQQTTAATKLRCSIDLQDIIQINEIKFIAYTDQQTTHTVKFTRGFDETLNKQYLISDYDNERIYAD